MEPAPKFMSIAAEKRTHTLSCTVEMFSAFLLFCKPVLSLTVSYQADSAIG